MLKLRNLAVSNKHDPRSKLVNNFQRGIWQTNQLSKRAGFEQAIRELESADPDYDADSYTDSVDPSISDWVNAKRIGISFAALYAAKLGDSDSVRTANKESLYRLETIAATESSSSYNEGRDIAAELYNGDKTLLKVWDSSMDRGTCGVCADADGETVAITDSFANGNPGDVHPNCRCTYSIITEAEAFAYLDKAA